MNLSDIISVDPAKTTLGALHPEVASRLLRNSRIYRKVAPPAKRTALNFFFASLAPGVNRFGGYMLLFRCLFAALLIVSGSFILYGEIEAPESLMPGHVFAIIEIVAGSMLALGFFNRLASLAVTIMFATVSVTSILHGVFDMQSFLTLFGCLLFLLLGTGKYSCDFLIRKAIIAKAAKRRNRLEQERLTYKAFRNAHIGG